MALSKEEVLQGTKKSFEVEIDALDKAMEDEDGVVTIRPLSYSEEKKIERIQMQGIDMSSIDQSQLTDELKDIKGERDLEEVSDEELKKNFLGKIDELDVDLSEVLENREKVDRLTCKYGLSTGDEKWTEEEVGSLRRPIVEEIAEKVWEITERDRGGGEKNNQTPYEN